ncbi:MAG: acyl-CoA dehydrogenase family protein [Proteobacteria bacterium]|nr:acyl-CoA dehydrogenase family protein [Pseudomonadota bacterium]
MEDFLHLDENLSADELMVRDTVHRFVSDEVLLVIEQAYESAEFPKQFVPRVAELGLLGMNLPTEYGGSAASYVSYGLACQELEKGDSGLRSFVSVQNSLCMYPIFRYGSDEQKKRFLLKMSRGALIGCFGLTEPDSGSDPASMKTHAKKTKGGWILNGNKAWITNAAFADLAIVWANTSEGIRGFIVEKEFSGFVRRDIHHKMSMRASSTGELAFSDCFVPDENYLPGSERGLGAPLSCLTQARYGIAWGAIGAAMACFDIALAYTKERVSFQKPIAANQLVQHDLTKMFSEIVKAQCLNLQIGRLKDQDKATPEMVSLAKSNACREALNIARTTRNLLGANGISLEYHVIRHMMNLESVFTYEGTDNIHQLILGKHITGISAF